MQKNICLTIEYDGSRYHGWQRQPNAPTIQATIEQALATITGIQVSLVGSGRTDAGVHALGQVANFTCNTRLGAPELQKGLNSLLPEDISIRNCRQVPPDFHARFKAISKVYRYRIDNSSTRPAIGRQYCWWIRRRLDIQAMAEGLRLFRGRHDFRAFEAAGSPRSNSVRHVIRAEIEDENCRLITITIEADGFLRYMVRNIVGTLAAVGLGRIAPRSICRLLAAGDRRLAPATAPAGGLFLVKVNYPDSVLQSTPK